MAASSSTGTSPDGSSLQPRNSSSDKEGIMVDVKDQKKRKRLISNRESARRSRLKKQNQLNSLLAEMKKLEEDNNQMLLTMSLSNKLYFDMEAENSVLRAQIAELTYRLFSLKEIINVISSSCYGVCDSTTIPFDHSSVNVMMDINGGYFSKNVLASPFYLNQPTTMAAPGRFI
ncbi:hypothetical protein ACOSQ2_023104 [Xanthoceras sorbifolium]